MKISLAFKGYKCSQKVIFSCSVCKKKNRSKTISNEHTVNPFNKNEDGSIKTYDQVKASSTVKTEKEVREFKQFPVCETCWVNMNQNERVRVINKRREALHFEDGKQ